MRVIKEAEVRKNEILDAAASLFAQKGFDHTTTNDIMNVVGIAKGTLYHHFKSKEDIMDALIERQTAQVLAAAGRIAGDRGIPVEERMIRTIQALHIEVEGETEGKELIDQLHRPQNALMHQKMKQIILRRVPPMMAGIVKDGIDQGIYSTPYPLECMEMTVCYLDIMLDDNVFELAGEQKREKVRAFLFLLERLLGVKEGQLAGFETVFL